MEVKRKTPSQLQSLEQLYSEDKYPTKELMEDYAAALELTCKQVRGWFVEKRRRDKRENGIIVPSYLGSMKKHPIFTRGNGCATKGDLSIRNMNSCSSLIYKRLSSAENRNAKRKKRIFLLQDLLTPDYILKKVFRKDGPPLGVEFDSLPSGAVGYALDSENSLPCCQNSQRADKRRKVSQHTILSHQVSNKTSAPMKKHGIGKGLMTVWKATKPTRKSAPMKKHGIGKGLMTVWRATNRDGGDFPTGLDFGDNEVASVSLTSTSMSRKKPLRRKITRQQVPLTGRLRNKVKDKRKQPIRRREVESNRVEHWKRPDKEKCELALEGEISQEYLDQVQLLMDDEELELLELQGGPNPLRCSDHFAANSLHGCSLCKDLLAEFPPNSVKMKQPFCMQPWESSLEIVKKLFKVFHFLYTYAVAVDLCSFTLDEFAQAFHDKDSSLLGKIHVALLRILISDVQAELSSGFSPDLSKSCNFLALLHSVENKKLALDFWERSLNPLTWTEILRQVLVAAGFGSKQGAMRREALSREMNIVMKYGLRPGTLKFELFKVLSEQGNSGLKVSDLAKSLQVVELNHAGTTEELESLICSTLASDITLFEKISSSAYRLRTNYIAKEVDEGHSDTEDSGSVDDDPNDCGPCSSSDDLGCESVNSSVRKLKYMNCRKGQNNMLTVYNEIDESHPGEVWLLGLMEGEYSDLSIEEKLNALVALTDLLLAGSSLKLEDRTLAIAESIPNIHHYGSGAKLNRINSDGEVRELLEGLEEAQLSMSLKMIDSEDLGNNSERAMKREKKKKHKEEKRAASSRKEVLEDTKMKEVVKGKIYSEKRENDERKDGKEDTKKEKKRKSGIEDVAFLVKNSMSGEEVGKEKELSDGKNMEKAEPVKKKRRKEKKNHTGDVGAGLPEKITDKPSDKRKGAQNDQSVGNEGNALSLRNETGVRNIHLISSEDDYKHVKQKKKKKKKVKSDKYDLERNCDKGVGTSRNDIEATYEDSTPGRTSKRVSFSDCVEVFTSDDGPIEGKQGQDGGFVRGKRFSREEDEMVKKAVFNYIEAHGLGDEGLNMVLHCKYHPEIKTCWKEIGRALPWRPYQSVYYRAHTLFERGEKRKWTMEEYELIRNFHKKHGSEWRMLADAIGKHRVHIKDTWRRIKFLNTKKGRWSQEEYQKLFDLVNMDLRMRVLEEKKSKHGMLRDNISWEAVSQQLSTRSHIHCCQKWYAQLTSPMVAEGIWDDADDYRLLDALFALDSCCIEDVDWDNLLEHRSGDVCRRRWDQMLKHIGEHASKSFAEQVEVLSKRYCIDILEAREAYDSKPEVS